MKRLLTRLEPLLRLSEHEFEARRRELEREREDHRAASEAADAAEAEAQRSDRELFERLEAGQSAAHARMTRDAGLRLWERTRVTRGFREGSEERVAAARDDLLAAWQHVRRLELLRERAREASRAEVARREQRELEEAARRRRAVERLR